jgi:hypothetical protein
LRWARSRGEVFSNTLMVRCERSEPRTMSQVHRPLPPPCGEGSGVGVARCSGSGRMRGPGRFSWPRWFPACAGMTPRTRCSWCPNRSSATVIPGLDPGIQPASPPARGAVWWMAGSVRRPTPTRLPPPSPQGEGDVRHRALPVHSEGWTRIRLEEGRTSPFDRVRVRSLVCGSRRVCPGGAG